MSLTEIIIRLVLVGFLVAYLCFRYWRRQSVSIPPSNDAEWTGKGIDVAPIKPTLEEVRRTYARPPTRGICFHRSLLALARRAVGHLAFFHERQSEPSHENHAN